MFDRKWIRRKLGIWTEVWRSESGGGGDGASQEEVGMELGSSEEDDGGRRRGRMQGEGKAVE